MKLFIEIQIELLFYTFELSIAAFSSKLCKTYTPAKIDEKGVTMVPLSLYLKKNLIKMEFGIAKGKKLWDKRKDKQDKDVKRKIDRKMKEYKNK